MCLNRSSNQDAHYSCPRLKKKYIAKITCGCFPTSTRIFTYKSEIFRHKTSHMVLSIIFLEDKHKIVLHLSIFHEYQQFFQHRICFSIQRPITNETSHVITHATHSDSWPTLARSTSLFLICCNTNINISHRLYSQGKHMWLLPSFWRHTSYCPQSWFAQLPAIVWKLEWEKYYRLKNICIFELHFIYTTNIVNSCIFLCKWLRS